MAPLPPTLKKPSATTLRHARLSGSVHPLAPDKTFRANASTSDSFLESKRDKRIIKHSSFVSRIASSSSRVSKSKKRSRKPSNNLTTLDSLADALPELEDGEGGAEVLEGKVRHKSLRSKKGALRRKERIVKGEMERFGVSMAKLTGMPEQQQQKSQQQVQSSGDVNAAGLSTSAPTANRWAALRGYISATMEQNPAFTNKN